MALSGKADEEIERAQDTRRNIETDGRALARRRHHRKLIRDVLKFVAASIGYFVVVYFGAIALLLDFDTCLPGTGGGTCKAAVRFLVAAIAFYAVLSFIYWFRYWQRHRHQKG